jgi:hypothetical protein
VTHKNSGNDWNEIKVFFGVPVPARFRAPDRKEFLQNYEPRLKSILSVLVILAIVPIHPISFALVTTTA